MSPAAITGRPAPARIETRELGHLREARLRAERLGLEARMAELALQRLVLRLERKYGLLGVEASIDVHTGRIMRSEGESRGPEHDAGPPSAGPA